MICAFSAKTSAVTYTNFLEPKLHITYFISRKFVRSFFSPPLTFDFKNSVKPTQNRVQLKKT